jgi:hypothetical protein
MVETDGLFDQPYFFIRRRLMKRYMSVLAVLVLGSAWSFGAYFVYDSSSMWAQSESTATDLDDMNGSDTQVDWKGGSEDTDVSIETLRGDLGR